MRADDALKYAAAVLRERTDWALDEIGGSMCDQEGHELQTNAIHDITVDIASLAELFGDPNVYSDGRYVKTSTWIDGDSLGTSHVWHPDPAQEKPASWRGNLPSYDPDIPSPGIYEVTTYPETQEIHVRVVRTA
ncbi:hypothetical protein BTO20_11220 [Mycobacterium dioxanotrophicus]|uniref:Uncharacterized protein n=1 Tax=Mycobacterium dioxanotrophicus TaxID=482462 RepID=A0A1Y0C1M0_9MYCO|nr:hypothetical protein [Mycobacterium dioxanotrophicus]ART69079.1 hypothetical protein BTO20_11220 [Mycobacterium dioxanotrophicus]